MKSYKIFIDSAAWFCEGNIIDSSRIYRYMIENGHKIINNPSNADYIIINSCGFIKDREDRSVKLINKYNSLKKENATIIIFGCLIKINPELINSLQSCAIDLNENEKFDRIFYNNTKFENIDPYCDEFTKQQLFYKKNVKQQLKYPLFSLTKLFLPISKKLKTNYNKIINSTTYNDKILVEICRGCASNCSYCVIKKAKGKVHSRTIKDILSDIKKIYDPSKKLLLVADDCSCYGVDINTNFFGLLDEINKKFPDLAIDIDAINPEWLVRCPNEYIKLFKDGRFNFVTIPVQSGSNKVLKNMNRHYDIYKVVKIVDKIKKVSPKTFIYSHFIVGYPGENWFDFFKTMICALHFDFPIFLIYSEHKRSASIFLSNQKARVTILARKHISNFFLSFVIFYKLLTHL
jgi:MiaB/RimO family radical SAM methylthiotransferase